MFFFLFLSFFSVRFVERESFFLPGRVLKMSLFLFLYMFKSRLLREIVIFFCLLIFFVRLEVIFFSCFVMVKRGHCYRSFDVWCAVFSFMF